MKKVFAVVLLSFAVATPALAAESPFYAGISLGSTNLPSTSTTSFGIFGGYKLNQAQAPFMKNLGTLAIEAHYTTLGEDKFGASFPGFGTWNVTAKYSSIGADVVALFPIKSVQRLSAFGKLGLASTSVSVTCTGTGAFANGTGCSTPGSTTDLVWGAGAQYDVDKQISVRGGYQTYASDVSTLYVAALYNF